MGGIRLQPANFLRNVLHIGNEQLLHEMEALCEVRTLKKGECLIRQGQSPTMTYFLIEGIFRGTIDGTSGKDITGCIVYQCGAPLVANSEIWGVAQIGIEALTASSVLGVASSGLQRLFPRFPELTQMYLRFLLWSSRMHWELKVVTYQYTALQRYQWFLQAYPGLIDQISHKHIASFLNMTPETLSKLIHASDGALYASETLAIPEADS